MTLKTRSITLLIIAEIMAMAVWFSSAAVIADLMRAQSLTSGQVALLTSSVQGGFAIGAICYAVFGIADRYDPRHVFAFSAVLAAGANALMLIVPTDSLAAIIARGATGAFLAGVYPVGMKIAVGWGDRDRGLLVGLLVGALTLGSAGPHLIAFWGGADWRVTIFTSSLMAVAGGAVAMATTLGPHHAPRNVAGPAISMAAIKLAWSDIRIRRAYAGYLGHMWELYAFWAWIGAALLVAFSQHADGLADATLPPDPAAAKLATFAAIGVGAIACVGAGRLADRIGKAETTIIAMAGSGAAAILAALAFDGPPMLLVAIVIIWGAFVIADSAQFSALVADAAPADQVGALLTLQTALGFALTMVTVQATPWVAAHLGWPGTFVILSLGPLLGVIAMAPLRQKRRK